MVNPPIKGAPNPPPAQFPPTVGPNIPAPTGVVTCSTSNDPNCFPQGVYFAIMSSTPTSATYSQGVATTTVSDSTTLHDFNNHGFWGVTMSLVIVITTLVFMVFAQKIFKRL
ncbi:hypothetical protein C1645_742915 [Glomus cerebriforme]|uniref:Uncharacterized protein n=1 Tax=Glomus cerebriforme TaxID=658196 RepID=A0A397SDQ7_9GLOM|nr:hypothetical protein C1645_742915 [Glomus cerebriforme]